jgi:predicted O-methyltransferase YrrM
MHELTKIAKRIGRSDKATSHGYCEFYGPLLQHKRLTAKNVLEIGISDGGSHLMWAEWFYYATIYGVDTREFVNESLDVLIEHPRIDLSFEDAYGRKFLNKIRDVRFDFILDDGPHTLESWEKFLRLYPKLLAENGVLAIEDIFTTGQAAMLIDGFKGDKNRLSIIDRRDTPSAYKEHFDNEILLVYM